MRNSVRFEELARGERPSNRSVCSFPLAEARERACVVGCGAKDRRVYTYAEFYLTMNLYGSESQNSDVASDDV